jgi:hypothetical protein
MCGLSTLNVLGPNHWYCSNYNREHTSVTHNTSIFYGTMDGIYHCDTAPTASCNLRLDLGGPIKHSTLSYAPLPYTCAFTLPTRFIRARHHEYQVAEICRNLQPKQNLHASTRSIATYPNRTGDHLINASSCCRGALSPR